jgi:hypothetical protein
MDKRIERKLKHIKNELSSDNVTLILEYFDAMKMETCGKVVQDKHLQCIYKMTQILDRYWKDATKKDVEKVVMWIIDKYTDVKGQETHAPSDYKKVLKIFFRWMKNGYRKKDSNQLDPIEIRNITIKQIKNRRSREDLITDDAEVFGAAFSRLANTNDTMLIESPPRRHSGMIYKIFEMSKLRKNVDANYSMSQFKIHEIPTLMAVEAGLINHEFLDA